jgi:hypothetical protein
MILLNYQFVLKVQINAFFPIGLVLAPLPKQGKNNV